MTTERTITFRFVDEFVLDYSAWYSRKKDDFKTEADAIAKWEAMCDGTDGRVEGLVADVNLELLNEACDEVQEEYEAEADIMG